MLHALFQRLRRQPKRSVRSLRLPWWGLVLSTQDKQVLQALVQSSQRLSDTLATPGWADVESVFHDWQDRYRDLAGRLGQDMKEQRGQLVLTEDDTVADDRRRLIACAQAAAIRGLLAELKQRAKVLDVLAQRDQRHQQDQHASGELL